MILIQPASMCIHWATLQHHSCLARSAASASSQVSHNPERTSLTVSPDSPWLSWSWEPLSTMLVVVCTGGTWPSLICADVTLRNYSLTDQTEQCRVPVVTKYAHCCVVEYGVCWYSVAMWNSLLAPCRCHHHHVVTSANLFSHHIIVYRIYRV